ncbi:MAG: ABC transporter permease, partial [Agathobacter sp.]|nr:ABC transporter permease [Agathobacter sp.]
SIYADRLIRISYGVIEKDVVQNEVGENVTDIEKYGVSLKESKQRSLSGRMCWTFAKEAMKHRKSRCFVSIMIFSITMLFILILSTAVFRNDSISMTDYIFEKKQRMIPLYMEILEEGSDLPEGEKTLSGKKFYEFISQCTDTSRIIRYGASDNVRLDDNYYVKIKNIYVSPENQQYFTYEGSFPQNANEIAISKLLADKISGNLLGSKMIIGEEEYIITAVVTHICGCGVKDLYMLEDDLSNKENENIVLFSTQALVAKEMEHGIYMSGFGLLGNPTLFYQATVYDYVDKIDDEIELIAGRMPRCDNEILISQYLYEFNKDVLGKRYKFFNFNDSQYGSTYWNYMNLWDYIGESFTIVGVVNARANYCVTPSLYDKLFEDYVTFYECKYCLLVDENIITSDLRNLLDNDVKIMGSDFLKIYMLRDGMEMAKIAVFAVIGGLALLSVLQMISLYSYSINDSKKTIGILRTMGVRESSTMKIFAVECMVVSIIAYIIAIVFSILVTSGINIFICEKIWGFDGFDFLRMRFIIVLAVGIISGLLSVLSVIIPIMKYSKLKIIDLIK